MKLIKKENLLKIFLRISALIQLSYWGLSHLFYPQWYLNSVGAKDFDISQGFELLVLNEIGILTIGMALATWLASYDPIKNFFIILTLYMVSIGSIIVTIYHIILETYSGNEWMTIIILVVQLTILSLLYPWPQLLKKKI